MRSAKQSILKLTSYGIQTLVLNNTQNLVHELFIDYKENSMPISHQPFISLKMFDDSPE